MDETRYQVVVKGVGSGVGPQTVREGIAALTRADPADFDDFVAQVFRGQRLVVKDNLDGELAQRYQEALEQVGLLCEQQPMLSLMPLVESGDQQLYRCPACETQQPLSGGQ
ncbi:MAG: hypothetical protein R3310_16800, partial [Candidatus Competibacteraceae bacterium]|nr:hypothetical protein [Candidatus Competibacteraceae bacterium]